jgi:hypothetical protein
MMAIFVTFPCFDIVCVRVYVHARPYYIIIFIFIFIFVCVCVCVRLGSCSGVFSGALVLFSLVVTFGDFKVCLACGLVLLGSFYV